MGVRSFTCVVIYEKVIVVRGTYNILDHDFQNSTLQKK